MRRRREGSWSSMGAEISKVGAEINTGGGKWPSMRYSTRLAETEIKHVVKYEQLKIVLGRGKLKGRLITSQYSEYPYVQDSNIHRQLRKYLKLKKSENLITISKNSSESKIM